jgi:small-conductance mechanosensitive channel
MPELPFQLLGPVLRIAGVLLVAFFGVKLVKRLITRVIGRVLVRTLGAGVAGDEIALARSTVRGSTLAGVLTALATSVIWVLALLIILGEVGINMAPLIAGLGIVGVALGFGAQNLVSDLVSGLFMLAEDQFGVGDIVDIDGVTGTVEHVGLRTTQVRALDGFLWTLRNGEIKRLANANKGWNRVVLDVSVGYDSDLRRASEVILGAASEAYADPAISDRLMGEPEIWGVEALGDDAVSIRLVCKTVPAAKWEVGRDLRLRIKEALDREGFEIPFPQRTVWLRTEPATLSAPIPFEQVNGKSDGAGRTMGTSPTAKPDGVLRDDDSATSSPPPKNP